MESIMGKDNSERAAVTVKANHAEVVTVSIDSAASKTLSPLVKGFIDSTDKAHTGGVTLLKTAAELKIPMGSLLIMFQGHASWPKDDKGAAVGMDKAASTKAGRAYGSLRKAASRYQGEGSGKTFVASLDSAGFMILAPVKVAEKAKTETAKGTDSTVPKIDLKDVEKAKKEGNKTGAHIALLFISTVIDKLRVEAKSPDAMKIIETLKAEIASYEKWFNLCSKSFGRGLVHSGRRPWIRILDHLYLNLLAGIVWYILTRGRGLIAPAFLRLRDLSRSQPDEYDEWERKTKTPWKVKREMFFELFVWYRVFVSRYTETASVTVEQNENLFYRMAF